MYLKEIILDGFKSYSSRTVISGFDRYFNAITGLNGSGKSNILDAICFVLGITNLSTLRAVMLQDLIYKSGTAGITTAMVSLVFDNSDREECPSGYEDVAEITVARQINANGKSKYTINGSAAQVKRITDLFCSVHLDVNNPHFLILQGQITKVLNMKPKEILGLIEGSAGTLSYDTKKCDVLKIIEKKDVKLAEIESILVEEIGPSIDRLKSQKSGYVELRKVEREIQTFERRHVIISFKKYKTEINNIELSLSKLNVQFDAVKDQKNQASKELSAGVSENVSDTKEMMEHKTNFRKAEQHVRSLNNDRAQLNSELATLKATITEQISHFDQVNTQIGTAQEELSRNDHLLQELNCQLEKNPLDQLDKKIEMCRQNLSDYQDCVIDEETGEAIHKNDLILRLKAAYREMESSLLSARAQVDLCKRERDLIYSQIDNEAKKHAEQIETELENINVSILPEEVNLENEQFKLDHKYESLKSQLLSSPEYFHYTDPCVGFDRRRVLGQLGCLITCKNSEKFGKAIESAIGTGRLLNLVVDNVDTAKLLLSKCSFKQRVTIIPLQGIKIHADVKQLARLEQKANELIANTNQQVWSALSLVDCESSVRPCVEFALNTKFICSDLDTAKLIAFHPSMGGRVTITLEGDVFDPAGILTGGSRQSHNNILLLTRLAEVANIESTLKSVEMERGNFERKKSKLMEQRQQRDNLQRRKCELERKLAVTGIIDLRNADNKFEKAAEILSMKEQQTLEIQNKLKQNADQQSADPEKMLTQLIDKRNELQLVEQQIEVLKLEIRDRRGEIRLLEAQLEKAQANKTILETQETRIKERADQLQNELNDAQLKLGEYDEQMNKVLEKQRSIDTKKENLQSLINSLELELKTITCEKRSIQDRLTQCKRKVEEISKKNPWSDEIDLEEHVDNCSEEEIERLKQIRTRLRRTVNINAVDMLGEKEEQYHELLRKEGIVKGNKAKIQAIIVEWDEHKRATLNKAWRAVSKDFGEIFSTLLPGASAKLDLSKSICSNSEDVLECGLDIHVGFGGEWKDSLVELSGGQRSLAAMSLILALLRYKPAPIYIMDEIDAALDMSHTQNMGIMIQRFFKESQFIIVSLKDGMFKNANVLFKTCFKDGISSIVRCKNC